MASFHRKDSFLKSTGVYDVFLDINNLPTIPKSVSDEKYVIEPKYHQLPDLLAYDKYGNSRVWWIVVLRNIDIIEDPVKDFNEGTEISLPSKKTVESIIT